MSHPGDGRSDELILRVKNPTDSADVYEIRHDGAPPGWINTPASLTVGPQETVTVWVTVTATVTSQYLPGSYPIAISVYPAGAPSAAATRTLALNVEGALHYQAHVDPMRAAGRRGRFTVHVQNNGTRTIAMKIDASDPEGRCKVKVESPVQALPGAPREAVIEVAPRRNSLVGPPEIFGLTVRLQPENESERWGRSHEVELEHRPLVGFRPVFLVAFLTIVGALTLFGVAKGPDLATEAATGIGCNLIDDNFRTEPGGPSQKKPECREDAKPSSADETNVVPTGTPASENRIGACTKHLDMRAGSRVRIVTADGVALRKEADPGAEPVVTPGLAAGEYAIVIENQPRCFSGGDEAILYWRIKRESDGLEGWAAEGNSSTPWMEIAPP
jgi:hypothetical protein